MKKRGVDALFLMSINGVLIMQHDMTLGFFSICLSSY
jgi:hypothetical protein